MIVNLIKFIQKLNKILNAFMNILKYFNKNMIKIIKNLIFIYNKFFLIFWPAQKWIKYLNSRIYNKYLRLLHCYKSKTKVIMNNNLDKIILYKKILFYIMKEIYILNIIQYNISIHI